MNIQDNNVGNRGDVVKHVALVRLAALLRRRNPGPIRHVETHTFRLDAPLLDPERWQTALGSMPPDEPYRALEAKWVASGRYRCSAGLAADTLGPPFRLLLAEAHPPTRDALRSALAAEGLPVEALLDDGVGFAELSPADPSPLLVHVDPFDHPARYWPAVEHLLSEFRRPDHDAIVLAFAYDKAAPIAWPPPPTGLLPLGRLDSAPYGLAAWASPGIAAEARETLGSLGWISRE